MPYGITQEHWDIIHERLKMNKILKQCNASQDAEHYAIVLYHNIRQSGEVYESLRENGCKNISNLYWHKTDHWTPTPRYQYTSSVEVMTIGFIPNNERCSVKLDKDPKLRMNFIECPAIDQKSVDNDGTVVNPCEKPPEIMKWICENHCMPGQYVLIIGSGANGDVKGAILAGCNVVAVESDKRQFDCASEILVTWEAQIRREIPSSTQALTVLQNDGANSQSQYEQPKTNPPEKADTKMEDVVEVCVVCGSPFDINEMKYVCGDPICSSGPSYHHIACGMDNNESGERHCNDHLPDAWESVKTYCKAI